MVRFGAGCAVTSRSRLLELMSAADLAKLDLQKEQVRAQRDAQNTSQWVGALSQLVPLAGNVLGKGMELADSNALETAANAVNAGTSARGAGMTLAKTGPSGPEFAQSYDQTPEQVAAGLVAGNEGLQAPVKSGNFLSDLVADPLGINSRARDKAATAARQGITKEIVGNRATDAADAKQKLGVDWSVYQGKQATKAAAAARAQAQAEADKKLGLEDDWKSALANQASGNAEETARHDRAMEANAARAAAAAAGKHGGSKGDPALAADKEAAKQRQAEIGRLTGYRESLGRELGRLQTSMANPMLDDAEKVPMRTRADAIAKQLGNVDNRIDQLWTEDLPPEPKPAAGAKAPAAPAAAPAAGKGWFSSLSDSIFGPSPAASAQPLPPAGIAGGSGPVKLSAADAALAYKQLDESAKAGVDPQIQALVAQGMSVPDAMAEVLSAPAPAKGLRRIPATLDLPGN